MVLNKSEHNSCVVFCFPTPWWALIVTQEISPKMITRSGLLREVQECRPFKLSAFARQIRAGLTPGQQVLTARVIAWENDWRLTLQADVATLQV